jgi:hypothetical protein
MNEEKISGEEKQQIEQIKTAQSLAAFSLFRELYNQNKDLYEIIMYFLLDVIIKEKKNTFSLTEITYNLNKYYGFDLLESVIKKSLQKSENIQIQDGEYYVANISELNSLDSSKSEISRNHAEVINGLLGFVASKKNHKLTNSEEAEVYEDLYYYLLDDKFTKNGHADDISEYIIINSNNNFTKILNSMREGVVLYSGIKYEDNFLSLDSWENPLTLFLDTEILFSLAGYNGELLSEMLKNFISLVSEINERKSGTINLKYFNEVESEVTGYFNMAEQVVSSETIFAETIAMQTIVSKADSPADIRVIESQFFELLKKNDILVDDYDDYYAIKNHKYNKIDEDLSGKISRAFPRVEDDIMNNILKFLNYISIRRENLISKKFENSRYILISAHGLTLRVGRFDEFCAKRGILLSSNIEFLINKLWYKLNKSFGGGDKVVSFDVITRAQIILSNKLNKIVSSHYQELHLQIKNNELDKETIPGLIHSLKNKLKKPEEFISESAESLSEMFKGEKLDDLIEKHKYEQNTAKEVSIENTKLKNDIEEVKKNTEGVEKKLMSTVKSITDVVYNIVRGLIFVVCVILIIIYYNVFSDSIILDVLVAISVLAIYLGIFKFDDRIFLINLRVYINNIVKKQIL